MTLAPCMLLYRTNCRPKYDLVFGALEHFVVLCTFVGERWDVSCPEKRAARVPADPGDDR